MFIHIKYFLINNFKPMQINVEAKVLEVNKQSIVTFKNGQKEEISGQVLEVKPKKHPGKTLQVKVFNTTEKFEEDKRYNFLGDFSISKNGWVNFEMEKATLLK
jgi:hypothetical protein